MGRSGVVHCGVGDVLARGVAGACVVVGDGARSGVVRCGVGDVLARGVAGGCGAVGGGAL